MGAPAGDCVMRGKWRRIDRADLPCAEVGLEASPGQRPGVRCCSRARQYHSLRHSGITEILHNFRFWERSAGEEFLYDTGASLDSLGMVARP